MGHGENKEAELGVTVQEAASSLLVTTWGGLK